MKESVLHNSLELASVKSSVKGGHARLYKENACFIIMILLNTVLAYIRGCANVFLCFAQSGCMLFSRKCYSEDWELGIWSNLCSLRLET